MTENEKITKMGDRLTWLQQDWQQNNDIIHDLRKELAETQRVVAEIKKSVEILTCNIVGLKEQYD